jgi:phosphonopyruvate decarboxylase
MQMGNMAIVGRSGCDNLTHIVFNNAAHDSVGGQPTIAGEIDFEKIAEELGYNVLQSPQDQYVNSDGIGVEEVFSGMKWLVTMEEQYNQHKPNSMDESLRKPNFILFKVAKGARKDLGRPKESPQVNKALYMKTLEV